MRLHYLMIKLLPIIWPHNRLCPITTSSRGDELLLLWLIIHSPLIVYLVYNCPSFKSILRVINLGLITKKHPWRRDVMHNLQILCTSLSIINQITTRGEWVTSHKCDKSSPYQELVISYSESHYGQNWRTMDDLLLPRMNL